MNVTTFFSDIEIKEDQIILHSLRTVDTLDKFMSDMISDLFIIADVEQEFIKQSIDTLNTFTKTRPQIILR